MVEKTSKSVRYGPYKDVKPMTYESMRIHWRMPYPMPIFTDVWRKIEVSHWGNIAVEEHFDLFNEGAELSGEFGRVDFNMYHPNSGQNALKALNSDLPYQIRGLYFYDYIGNVSSSNAFRHSDKVRFEIQPRFPIFGGWKIDW